MLGAEKTLQRNTFEKTKTSIFEQDDPSAILARFSF